MVTVSGHKTPAVGTKSSF